MKLSLTELLVDDVSVDVQHYTRCCLLDELAYWSRTTVGTTDAGAWWESSHKPLVCCKETLSVQVHRKCMRRSCKSHNYVWCMKSLLRISNHQSSPISPCGTPIVFWRHAISAQESSSPHSVPYFNITLIQTSSRSPWSDIFYTGLRKGSLTTSL